MSLDEIQDQPIWALIIGSVALVVVGIIMLLGLTVVGGITDGVSEAGPPENRTSDALFTDSDGNLKDGLYRDGLIFDTYVSFQSTFVTDGDVLQVYHVNDSTGDTIRLRGADDSQFQSNEDIEFASDDTWSVATWGEWNNSYGTTNGTLLSLNGRVLIQYDNQSQQWIGWWYDDGSRDSYNVTVSSTNQPGTLEHITLVHNGTHLAIYRNNTQGDVVNTTGDNTADPLLNASNWAGRIEESRGYDDALNSSQRQQLRDSPVLPLNGANRTFRLMYDQGSGDRVSVYFTGSSATLQNTTWTDGHPGTVLTEGTDYELDVGDGDISPNDGGRLDGAPVAWVDYEFEPSDFVAALIPGIRSGFTLFGTSVLVIPAAAVLAALLGSIFWAFRVADTFDSPFNRRNGGR